MLAPDSDTRASTWASTDACSSATDRKIAGSSLVTSTDGVEDASAADEPATGAEGAEEAPETVPEEEENGNAEAVVTAVVKEARICFG